MTKLTRRQRKRAAKEAKAQELLVLRAELLLLCDGQVPQRWVGLNTYQTRTAIAIRQRDLTRGG